MAKYSFFKDLQITLWKKNHLYYCHTNLRTLASLVILVNFNLMIKNVQYTVYKICKKLVVNVVVLGTGKQCKCGRRAGGSRLLRLLRPWIWGRGPRLVLHILTYNLHTYTIQEINTSVVTPDGTANKKYIIKIGYVKYRCIF